MAEAICSTHSHIIHTTFAHTDGLQSEAVKKELFKEKVNDTFFDVIDHLGQSSGKHGDLHRLIAGIKVCKRLTAGELGSRAQDLQKKIELLSPF